MAIDLTLSHTATVVATGTSTTLDRPTGLQEDDLILFSLWGNNTAVGNWTPPSGLTLYYSNPRPGSPLYGATAYYYWKRATASEPSSYTWTHNSGLAAGICWPIRGVLKSGDPEDAAARTSFFGNSVGPTCSSITTDHDNAAVVLIAMAAVGAASVYLTTSTMTARASYAGWLHISADIQASAGASGTKQANSPSAGGTQYNWGMLTAFREQPPIIGPFPVFLP